MNVAAMAVITLLIGAEKSLPHGWLIGRVAGVILLVYGALVVAVPRLLPA
jgi:predicted metal-binding membrane protein